MSYLSQERALEWGFHVMGLKSKIIVAGMIIRDVASFGLALYAFVNFVKWLAVDSRVDLD